MLTFTWELHRAPEQDVSVVPHFICARPAAWLTYSFCQGIPAAELETSLTAPHSSALCFSFQFSSALLKAAIGNIILFHNLLSSKWVQKGNDSLLLLQAAGAFFPWCLGFLFVSFCFCYCLFAFYLWNILVNLLKSWYPVHRPPH